LAGRRRSLHIVGAALVVTRYVFDTSPGGRHCPAASETNPARLGHHRILLLFCADLVLSSIIKCSVVAGVEML